MTSPSCRLHGFLPANQQQSGNVTGSDLSACAQSAVAWGHFELQRCSVDLGN